MANPETLNDKLLVNGPVHTGVYLDHHRHTAIVVKVKEGMVHYLTFITGQVTLEMRNAETFASEFFIQLYMYPVLRAVRKYATCGLAITPEARVILRAILKG